jgi:hypothetical protein
VTPDRPRDLKGTSSESAVKRFENTMGISYDTFSMGFDLPASMQLNRLNQKIDRMHIMLEKKDQIR